MPLLDKKSWQAQDLYNEYLELKTAIPSSIGSREYFLSRGMTAEAEEIKVILDQKIDRLKIVLNQLKIEHGVAMEDLILLSVGVDV